MRRILPRVFPSTFLAATAGAGAFFSASCPTAAGAAVSAAPAAAVATYHNPIERDVADPHVLKHRGEYYLVRTGRRDELDVLTSRDLVHWKQGPVIWKPASPDAPNARLLWAPELYYENGVFYLYFSADDRKGSGARLWVATSNKPTGPYKTLPAGSLTAPWRIDVSTFQDDDGSRYLFACNKDTQGSSVAARARVEGKRISGPFDATPGAWTPLLATAQDPWWAVWTEAPTVFKDPEDPKLYYMLYSYGGAHLPTYRVGWATASSPLGPWIKHGLLIPNRPGIAGPGHQAVVLAPDNLTPYLVYHRKRLAERGWGRDLMIDRMQIAGGMLKTYAPTLLPQEAPPQPAFADHFDSEASLKSWATISGDWRVDTAQKELQQTNPRSGRARLSAYSLRGDGVIEVNLRRQSGNGALGVALTAGNSRLPIWLLYGGAKTLRAGNDAGTPLGAEFKPDVYHQLLLTRRGTTVSVQLDGRTVKQVPFASGTASIELITDNCTAAFSGVAVTAYAKPLPLGAAQDDSLRGWSAVGTTGRIEQRALGGGQQVYTAATNVPGGASGSVSVTLQGWALGITARYPKYGIRVAQGATDFVEAFIDPGTAVLATHARIGGKDMPWRNAPLPLGFEYTNPHAVGLRWNDGKWTFTIDGAVLLEREDALPAATQPRSLLLLTEDARAAFSNITVTPDGK